MNDRLLLVNGITLLYRESQLTNVEENSSQLVREIVQSIKLPEINVGFDHDRDILSGLKATALYMCETPHGHKYEVNELLQRLRIDTADDENLYQALVEGITPELSEDAIKRTCINIKRSINSHFREEKIKDIVNKAAYSLKFTRNKITDMKAFVSELSSQLEPYMIDVVTKDPAIISKVNINNIDEITNIFNDVKENSNGTGILKTGYQGINRMLGGGLRSGLTVIGALQNKWKTGFSLTLFKQIALYNKPRVLDPNKKAMLLRISAEDDLSLNFQFLYQSLKENETRQKVDIKNISVEEMATYVKEKLSVNGFEIEFLFINPSLWSYRDLFNYILEVESRGFEVRVCMFDYLIKMPTTGCDQGPAGTDVFNLYERVRNFMKSRDIVFITPHQLSSEAKMMIREGRSDFVKELPGRGYYMKSRQIDQVVDLEIYIHIEKVNGKSYLTVQRGRHRIVDQIPDEYEYCVLPFQDIKLFNSGILDDINGPDTTCRKVGGGPIGSDDEIPFWCTDSI
jgi:hypothetical protein